MKKYLLLTLLYCAFTSTAQSSDNISEINILNLSYDQFYESAFNHITRTNPEILDHERLNQLTLLYINANYSQQLTDLSIRLVAAARIEPLQACEHRKLDENEKNLLHYYLFEE